VTSCVIFTHVIYLVTLVIVIYHIEKFKKRSIAAGE